MRIDLPKKVRALAPDAPPVGQKAAGRRARRARRGSLPAPKTKAIAIAIQRRRWRSATRSDRRRQPRSTRASPRRRGTCRGIDVLPVQGINVYDILRHDMLVLTTGGVDGAGGAVRMSEVASCPARRCTRSSASR
jgi:large subunit ribosomal protein L4